MKIIYKKKLEKQFGIKRAQTIVEQQEKERNLMEMKLKNKHSNVNLASHDWSYNNNLSNILSRPRTVYGVENTTR